MSFVLEERKIDVQSRGKDHLVYDRNGRVIPLEQATVWVDAQEKYVKPESYIARSFCIIL